jgi:hypothetical protein
MSDRWDVISIRAVAGVAAEQRIYQRLPVKTIVIPESRMHFRLYAGENKTQLIGEFFPGESVTVILPSSSETLYAVWGTDVNYAVRDAEPLETLAWVTSGEGLLNRSNVNQPEKLTFTADYKAASRPFPLTHVFAAQGRYQFASIWHPLDSTRDVRLRSVLFGVVSVDAAVDLAVELVRVVNQPSGGNPTITPAPHTQLAGSAEAACLALPTTQPSEISTIRSSRLWRLGMTGAPDIGPYPQPVVYAELVPVASAEGVQPYILPAGTQTGYTVTVDVSAGCTVSAHCLMTFTED